MLFPLTSRAARRVRSQCQCLLVGTDPVEIASKNSEYRRLLAFSLSVAWCLFGCKPEHPRGNYEQDKTESAASPEPSLVIWLQLKTGVAQIELSPKASALIESEYASVMLSYTTTTMEQSPPSVLNGDNRRDTGHGAAPARTIDNAIGMIMKKTSQPSSEAKYIVDNFRFWITADYKPMDFLNDLSFSKEFDQQFSDIIRTSFTYINE